MRLEAIMRDFPRAVDLGARFGSVPFVVLYRKHALKRPALRFIFEQLTG